MVAWPAGRGLWAHGLRGMACTGEEGCSLGCALWDVVCVVTWPVDVASGGWCGPQGVTYGRGRTLQALLLAFRTAVSGRQVPTCTDVLGLETGMHVHLLT